MLRRGDRALVFITILVLLGIVYYQSRDQSANVLRLPDFDAEIIHDDVARSSTPSNQQLKQHIVQKEQSIDLYENISYLLPNDVVTGVKSFVFFIGHALSGHSVVASMLNAHPHIVIAHEYGLFKNWHEHPSLHSNKNWLFSALYTNSKLLTKHSTLNGYSLTIPNSWQGNYDDYISIIGDKSGEMTIQEFTRDPDKFKKLYHELRNALQIPVRIFYVVRNPYDNIATMLLYNVRDKYRGNGTTKYIDFEGLEGQISIYFNQVKNVMDMIHSIPLDNVIEIHNSDMIASPKEMLRKLCSQLYISCSAEYVHMCTERTFVAESKTRHLVEWNPRLIDMVAQKLQQYRHLERYRF